MKKQISTSFLLLILVMAGNISFGQKKKVAIIDSIMQLAHTRRIFNGNILVADKNKIIYEASFGYADGITKKKLNKSMLFDIGSVSKEFNGVAIMILKERGMLRLNDPVSKFLPEFSAWADSVKIQNLINYTSGIPLFDPLALETDSAIMHNLKNLKALKFEPGTAYIYNHYNVYLQMRIIEKASGKPYGDFIRENIFIPCRMVNTIVDYPTTGDRMAKAFDNELKPTKYIQGMSGWVRLPVRDIYSFVVALDNYRIISKESYRELAKNFTGGESSLGSTAFDGDILNWHQHQGSNSNYESMIYSMPKEGITIVMLTNNQQMKVYGIKSAILSVFKNDPVIVPKKSVYLSVREKMLQNVDEGITYYNMLKAKSSDTYDFSFEIGDLISTGKYLQRRKHFDDAIKIFSMAVKLNGKPTDISYVYELMGETYLKKNDKQNAVLFYGKAIETDAENKNATGMLSTLIQK